MKIFLVSMATLILMCSAVKASASDELTGVNNKKRPVIGLVLSGGGARGASHVGVLKVLEEMQIPIDIITGTSMGAIVGGLYAHGYSPTELEKLLDDVDWDKLFIDKPRRSLLNFRRKSDDNNFLIKLESGLKNGNIIIPPGLVQGQKLNLLLRSLTLSAPEQFDDLTIRFRAVAADIETGEAVVMGEGDLATVMRASLSIPGVFSPVEWNGRLLVDGGFANNIPVKLARELGADILIVVDLSSEPRQRDELSSPLSILNQTLGFQILRNSVEQLSAMRPQDILLQPDLGNYSSTAFGQSKFMVARGIAATKPLVPRLKQLSLSEDLYKTYLASIRQKIQSTPRIDKIVVDNQSRLGTDVIKAHIETEPGEQLDIPGLEKNLARIFGINIFKNVDYQVDQDPEGTKLVIKAEEKDWGPGYIRFGMNLESDFAGSSKFNVATSYTNTPINKSGGEWRTELQLGYDQRFFTEFYQPMDNRLRYFIKTWATYSKLHFGRFEAGRQAADYIATTSTIGFGAGRLFGNWGSLEFGISAGSIDTEPVIGDLSVNKSDVNNGAWFVQFSYDQLDSLNFPKNGTLFNTSWRSDREWLGSDVEQDTLNVSLLRAATWGSNTWIAWTGLGGVVNSEIATQSGYAIGGFFSLSGFENFELVGRYAGVLRLIYFREIGGSQSALKIPFYIGGSVEAGNVWNDRNDIRFDSLLAAGSFLVAFDTPVGPLYLSKGIGQGGRSKTYLFLGRSFTFF